MEKTPSTDEQGFICLVVLAEVGWALASLYCVDCAATAEILTGPLSTPGELG